MNSYKFFFKYPNSLFFQNNENVFTNPDLVVRIGDQYYTWSAACPIVMSAVLYGRGLPSDLVKVIKASYQEDRSSSKRLSSGEVGGTSHNSKVQTGRYLAKKILVMI